MTGLYVHIPFCSKKCHYCDYVITTKRSPEFVSRFFCALEKETQRARERLGMLSFDTLYLGGGTPSALSGEDMIRLVRMLRSHFSFADGGEATCEINPGDVDGEKLAVYRELGINRVSIGAQSFDDALLKDMGRPHTARDIVETVTTVKEKGFENISLNIIVRLPRQTIRDVRESIRQAVSLGAHQIAVYDLDLHDRTVYGGRRSRGELKLPDEESHAEMMAAVEEELATEGFIHYELTSFAKPGFESRHNLIYWHNQEYLGLGPGAFSYLGGMRYQFAPDVNRYLQKCDADDWTNDTEDRILPEEKEMETLVTGLRLREGIAISDYPLIAKKISPSVRSFTGGGFFEEQNGRMRLTKRGRFVADRIFSELAGAIL
jgi:oxygen-independent coproporphyrinogen-3 oxidase